MFVMSRTSELKPGRTVVLSVFVWMPSYDYDKMMELARVQRRVEQMARNTGLNRCDVLAVTPPRRSRSSNYC